MSATLKLFTLDLSLASCKVYASICVTADEERPADARESEDSLHPRLRLLLSWDSSSMAV